MATILKATGTESRHSTPKTVPFNFGDVTVKAEQYLAEVRGQAEQIIAEAHQQAEQIREQAKRDGAGDAVIAAEETMQQKVLQQLQFLVPAIQEAVVEVDREKVAWMQRWEADALKIAHAIAERVVRREIQQHPEITLQLLREALQLASGLGALKIRLHPQDYEALRQTLDFLLGEMQKLTPTEVVADESISPGGCRVDTEYGSIDQQVDTQLERIRAELTPQA